jgi:hypothetical protein
MTDLSQVLLLSLLPGVGNFAGSAIADIWEPSPRLMNWSRRESSSPLSQSS